MRRSSVVVLLTAVAGTAPGHIVAQAPPSSEIAYPDYRDVGGLKVPFRLRERATEWRVRDFRYDVEINPKTFRPTTPLETGGYLQPRRLLVAGAARAGAV